LRILIDTNIVIPLEDSTKVLEESLSKLVRLASENGHQLLAHPSSYDDIGRDPDLRRRKISLSRLRKYSTLQHPPKLNTTELSQLGLLQRDDNDRVDNEILYALYRDAANILVTEDRELHKKAFRIGISDRVHYIQQATSFLEHLHARVGVVLPSIEEVPLHQIDLKNSFFDSLRSDYEFDRWYQRKAREGRTAWVYRDPEGNPGAIAIFKEERDPIVTNDNRALPRRTLKLCTFKVAEQERGRKLGELLLKAAFRYATNNRLEHIYITMRPGKQDFLEDLCADFGFTLFGEYKNDHVFVKQHPIHPPDVALPPLEYHRLFYPHILSNRGVGKYIVPIRPEFHKVLFPEIQSQPSLFGPSSAGHVIKQAYLCHARISGIRPGDILLFYRSQDIQAITSIGVVESVHEYQDHDKILQLVSKRTVYSYDDIVKMAEKKTKVILFRLATHLQDVIPSNWLSKQGVVNGQIQTIRKISDEAFRKVVDECRLGNCFFAD
jgi:predicted nucleic acid-binding protein/GNAT superfamily N-acetyltransferase